jgi:hypothetical protein
MGDTNDPQHWRDRAAQNGRFFRFVIYQKLVS